MASHNQHSVNSRGAIDVSEMHYVSEGIIIIIIIIFFFPLLYVLNL